VCVTSQCLIVLSSRYPHAITTLLQHCQIPGQWPGSFLARLLGRTVEMGLLHRIRFAVTSP